MYSLKVAGNKPVECLTVQELSKAVMNCEAMYVSVTEKLLNGIVKVHFLTLERGSITDTYTGKNIDLYSLLK